MENFYIRYVKSFVTNSRSFITPVVHVGSYSVIYMLYPVLNFSVYILAKILFICDVKLGVHFKLLGRATEKLF